MSPQCETILAHLRNGYGITTLIAMNPPFNCCRLSERIREIEREGWLCTHERIKTESGKRVTYYTLLGRRPAEQLPLDVSGAKASWL